MEEWGFVRWITCCSSRGPEQTIPKWLFDECLSGSQVERLAWLCCNPKPGKPPDQPSRHAWLEPGSQGRSTSWGSGPFRRQATQRRHDSGPTTAPTTPAIIPLLCLPWMNNGNGVTPVLYDPTMFKGATNTRSILENHLVVVRLPCTRT